MRNKLLIAGAMLMVATPAMAGWGKTNWGMKPAQVIAAVPGAVAVEPSEDSALMGLDQRATATVMEGKIALNAGFFFSPDTNGLELVDLVADDNKQCPDYLKALTARLGKGVETRKDITIEDYELVQLSVEWVDRASGDRLSFLGVFMDDQQTQYALCKLMHGGPGT